MMSGVFGVDSHTKWLRYGAAESGLTPRALNWRYFTGRLEVAKRASESKRARTVRYIGIQEIKCKQVVTRTCQRVLCTKQQKLVDLKTARDARKSFSMDPDGSPLLGQIGSPAIR